MIPYHPSRAEFVGGTLSIVAIIAVTLLLI